MAKQTALEGDAPEVIAPNETPTATVTPERAEAFPGPEILEGRGRQRPPIECHDGFVAVAVPETSLPIYRQLGYREAFHTSTGRADAGIVKDEAKFHMDPGGRLMQDQTFIMVIRPDTHAAVKARMQRDAEEPIQQMRRNKRGKEGRDPDFFAVAYDVKESVRPPGAKGPLVHNE